ncbi:hypothetical protein AB4Z09_20540 [Rhodococcus sp. TAF43]|nr:hypothetical protein [Rhodococcus sp. W8901]
MWIWFDLSTSWAAGYRYLLNLLNAGLEQVVFSADPEYPEVVHLQDNTKW